VRKKDDIYGLRRNSGHLWIKYKGKLPNTTPSPICKVYKCKTCGIYKIWSPIADLIVTHIDEPDRNFLSVCLYLGGPTLGSLTCGEILMGEILT
jgi:hypothetical protein